MKKLIALLAAVLVLVTCVAIASAETMYVDTANHKTLNLRDAHDINSVIYQIPYRAAVEVDTSFAGRIGWLYVYYKDYEGLVQAKFLSETQPPKDNTPRNNNTAYTDNSSIFTGMQKTNYIVTISPSTPTGYVNLRWAPSKSAMAIRKCYLGETWRVIAENNTWAQIINEDNTVSGYVMRSLIQRAVGTTAGEQG